MTTGRVYVSTGGDRRRPAVECAGEIVDRSSHRVELSGGRPLMDPEAEVATLAGRRELLLHNYFPPPEEPFVLNLAEPDADTAESDSANNNNNNNNIVLSSSRKSRPPYKYDPNKITIRFLFANRDGLVVTVECKPSDTVGEVKGALISVWPDGEFLMFHSLARI